MIKLAFFLVAITSAQLLIGVQVSIEPSLFGGRLIIENHQHGNTDEIIKTIENHTTLARGWWKIIIKSENDLDLDLILRSPWVNRAMASWIFGFKISLLDLSQCQINVGDSPVNLGGSSDLTLVFSDDLAKDSHFKSKITDIKKNNTILGHRGIKIERILDRYQRNTKEWRPMSIN